MSEIKKIWFNIKSIDRLCEESSEFLNSARSLGKAETRTLMNLVGADCKTLEEFKQSYADDLWTAFGYSNLTVIDVNEREIKVKLEKYELNSKDYVHSFLEGSVSEILGDDFIAEASEDGIVTLKRSVGLSFGKEELDPNKSSAIKYVFGPGSALLLGREKEAHFTYQIFDNLLFQGKTGLVLTRKNPEHIRKQYGWKNTDIFWITDRSGDTNFAPARIEFEIDRAVERFIKTTSEEGNPGVLLCDCLEYLMLHNDNEAVLKRFLKWKDSVAERGAIMLVPAEEKAIPTYFPRFEVEYISFDPKKHVIKS